MNKVIIYHAQCNDGCHAAAVAKLKFGDSATYIPSSYQDPVTDIENSDVILLDICYPPEILEKLIRKGNSVTVIDHHADQVGQVIGLRIDNVTIHFDPNESGASLAWKQFFPKKEMPSAILYAKDYDLWRFEYPQTKIYAAALAKFNFDLDAFGKLITSTDAALDNFIINYEQVHTFKMSIVDSICIQAKPITLLGESGYVVNGPSEFASELGNRLASKEGSSFGLVWNERANGKIKLSFRSNEGDAPKRLAQHFGGNGHDRAAGAEVEIRRFLKEIHKTTTDKEYRQDACCEP